MWFYFNSYLLPLLGGSVAVKQQHGGNSVGGGGGARRPGLPRHHPPPPGSQEWTQRHHQVRLAVWSSGECSGLRLESDSAACACLNPTWTCVLKTQQSVRARSAYVFVFFVLSQYNVFLSSLLNHGVTRWLRRIRLLTDAYVSIAIKQLLLLMLENCFRSCCNSYCCVSCESRYGKRALAFRHPEELWRLVLLQQLQLLLLSRQTLQLLLTPLPQWYL